MSPKPEMVNDEEPQNEPLPEAVVAEEESPQLEPVIIKPSSNVYTLLLLISVIFSIISIYLVGWELRNFYNATFGILQTNTIQKEVPLKPPSPSEPVSPPKGG